MGTAYGTAVGNPPVITSLMWKRWYALLLAFRIAECPVARTTTYYFAQSGNDSTGDGSLATPWKTLSKAQAIHDASSGDIRLRFNRGDSWLETAGLQITKNNVTVDDYGTGAKPLFTGFVAAPGSGWSAVSGDVYSRTLSNSPACGWVRDINDPLGDTNGPFALGTSSTLTPYQWWHDTTNNLLYVNAGVGIVPTSRIQYCLSETTISGVAVSGDGCRVQNIRCDGFGMNPASFQTQHCGIQSTTSGTNCALFVGCESYFNASHSIQHYQGAGSGGIATFIGCIGGWNCPTGAANFTNEDIFNGYANTGGHEVIFHGCTVAYGVLPDSNNGAQSATDHRGGSGALAHVGSGNIGLYVCYGMNYPFPVNGYGVQIPSAGVSSGAFSTDSDLTAGRSFVVGEWAENAQQLLSYSGTSFANCYWRVKPTSASHQIWASGTTADKGIFLNCIVEADPSLVAGTQIQYHNSAGADTYIGHLGCLFRNRGAQNPTQNITSCFWDTGLSATNHATMIGCILDWDGPSASRRWSGNSNAYVTLDNNIYGSFTSTSATAGDSNAVRVTQRFPVNPNVAANVFTSTVALAIRGYTLEYDYTWKKRPALPSIGPFEPLAVTPIIGIGKPFVGGLAIGG